MTVWKVKFGNYDDWLLVSTKEEAERVMAIFKNWAEHPKVRSDEVYGYTLMVNGRAYYTAADKKFTLALQEIEVMDHVPVTAMTRKIIEVDVAKVMIEGHQVEVN